MKNGIRFVILLLCMISVAALLGCAGSRTSKSAGEMIDDGVIATKVKAALYADKEVSGTQVQVETFKGTVQLSGFVDRPEQSQKAEQIARDVKGVKEVKNNISVK
ncbi:MAG: BON domain-containing protein [Candidatus Tectomicrobia bacterium]|nr:BON domain-containing protein [Candidatus Tectomicrobia bacterium]